MPRLCWMMMTYWGQDHIATWVIYGILETYNETMSIICLYKWYNWKELFHTIPTRYYMPRFRWIVVMWGDRVQYW